jgi:hypothetical protein
VRGLRLSIVVSTTLGLLAAGRAFAPYNSVKPILSQGPPELRDADESAWIAWAARHDREIRARLKQGNLDSMVNLLLYGTSFTRQPRISMEGEGIVEASRAGVLRARVDDLVAGLGSPGDNERLVFLQQLLNSEGIDPGETGKFILQNLQRVVQERKTLAERAAAAKPSSPLDRASVFRDRGLSVDTGIFPNFAIEQTLRDLAAHGVLRAGEVARVAVVGPGLDFIDKSEASAYDYYPEQTLQPFALYDSLVRLGLAKANALSMSIFDINPQVIQHLERARQRARKNIGYVIQLPHNAALPAPPELAGYWKSLGDQVGTAIPPIAPPRIFQSLETRAVRIRPDVVLACEPIDLNIVLERRTLAAANQFDLIVGTNIFVYYDAFEQSLALENAGAMLKPGGLLLTNDRLPVVPGGSMRLEGATVVPVDSSGVGASQAVGWYKKQ